MKPSSVFFVVAVLFTVNGYSQDGAAIFKKNCAVCHTVGKGKLVGPDLKGTHKKYESKWLAEWIKSSQKLVKKNDETAVRIFNENNKMVMPDQALSDDEIKTVVAFIGDETTKLEQLAAAPKTETVTPPSETQPTVASHTSAGNINGVNSKAIIYVLLGIIAFLTGILIILSKVIRDIIASNKAIA